MFNLKKNAWHKNNNLMSSTDFLYCWFPNSKHIRPLLPHSTLLPPHHHHPVIFLNYGMKMVGFVVKESVDKLQFGRRFFSSCIFLRDLSHYKVDNNLKVTCLLGHRFEIFLVMEIVISIYFLLSIKWIQYITQIYIKEAIKNAMYNIYK